MFIKYDDPSIRYTGRFGQFRTWHNDSIAATACGSYFELAFGGRECVLNFCTEFSTESYGHIWISVDGGARVEATISRFIRLRAERDGDHTVKVIYKSSVEQQHRWHTPLVGKLAFLGYEADRAGILAPDDRKTIEFVGDSITEGVLIDADRRQHTDDQFDRPWQDDAAGTYAFLTAEALGLRPYIMGYGAVGATKSGCGGVPKAALAYPYNFEGSPVTYPSCDIIVVNHGANDRGNPSYADEYTNLLKLIRERNPKSTLVSLSPFCGCFDELLPDVIESYNKKYNDNVVYISTHGWIPAEPLHPLYDGHRIVAEHLAERLSRLI